MGFWHPLFRAQYAPGTQADASAVGVWVVPTSTTVRAAWVIPVRLPLTHLTH